MGLRIAAIISAGISVIALIGIVIKYSSQIIPSSCLPLNTLYYYPFPFSYSAIEPKPLASIPYKSLSYPLFRVHVILLGLQFYVRDPILQRRP